MPNGLIIHNIINRMSPEEIFWNRKEAIDAIKAIIPIITFFDFSQYWIDRVWTAWQNLVDKFVDDLSGETAETILKGLLSVMQVRILVVDPIINGDFRSNLHGFKGKYQFYSEEDNVDVLVKFANIDMDWEETFSSDYNVMAKFKNGSALNNFLFNFLVKNDRDVLGSLTKNEIRVKGNLNYLFKFLFMVNHLLLEAKGQLPH